MASFKTRKARVRISPLSDHLHPESGHDKKQQLQLQCLLMPHKISPSVSLSHPLIGINRPLVSLLIPTSHRSDTWGKGFRAAQVHSERKITGSIGKCEKKKKIRDDAAELCNSSVPTPRHLNCCSRTFPISLALSSPSWPFPFAL